MGIGWSIHRNGGWIGQLERVQRWHDRLMFAARGETNSESDFLDFAFVFFQNCFHLREWVQHTSTIPQADLDAFMARTDMKVCRDLANGTKHLNISRPSIDPQFSIGREHDPWKRERYGYRLFVITGDEKFDLLDLASRCLQEWQDFLKPHSENVKNALPSFLTKRGDT